ncbi:MAG: DUF4058 family protein [Planctomycetales bacterium]
MPIHDWTRVDAGVFHDFHHAWIEEIKRALNSGLLPPEFYALAEQHAAGFGPDVLALETARDGDSSEPIPRRPVEGDGGGLLLAPPSLPVVAESDLEFYRRKQSALAIRHVSGDHLVAMIEIVSPGNKSGRKAWRDFVEKAAALLELGIHLLLVDLFPPSRRDPHGLHGAIWEEVAGQDYVAPELLPLTLAAYEADLAVRAYVQPTRVGERLVEMPLFLRPGGQVPVPLEATYQSAWGAFPGRWQRVVAG